MVLRGEVTPRLRRSWRAGVVSVARRPVLEKVAASGNRAGEIRGRAVGNVTTAAQVGKCHCLFFGEAAREGRGEQAYWAGSVQTQEAWRPDGRTPAPKHFWADATSNLLSYDIKDDSMVYLEVNYFKFSPNYREAY